MIAAIAIKCLKNIPCKKLKLLVENITVVIEDFKPSFLFDICAVNFADLSNMIRELNNAVITKEPLILLSISNEEGREDFCDYLIGKKSCMIAAIENCISERIMIIDSSLENKSPITRKLSELPKLHSMLIYIKSILENPKNGSSFISIRLNTDWSGTTLFGVLLGFPVTYYCNSENNNLSYVDLFQVVVKHNFEPVAQWTIPLCFVDNHNFQERLNIWKNGLPTSSGFLISENTISLPSVAL